MNSLRAVAPVRVCDLGGWTDTWFAGHGAVLNVAVAPGVEVVAGPPDRSGEAVLDVRDFGDRYVVEPGRGPGRHPLLEACIEEIPPPDAGCELAVSSAVPAGSAMGTSASVAVALLAALDAIEGGGRSPADLAAAAHRVETERLGLQSGIQDQLAAAHGGVSFIEMHRYPEVSVTSLNLDPHVWEELDGRLVVVFLGRAHASSAVHEEVIASLEHGSARLEPLRQVTVAGRDALVAGDLEAFARAMNENTEAQAALHPDLVSADARELGSLAVGHGAAGWKVNGAGGDGGSVTILLTGRDRRQGFVQTVSGGKRGWRALPVRMSRDGVRVVKFESG